MRFLIINTIFLLFFLSTSNAQTLSEKLDGKTNFKEICNIANAHYAELNRKGESRAPTDMKEKHFRRWEWFMRNRLNEKGEIFNSNKKILEAHKALKKESNNSEKSTLSSWNFLGPTDYPSTPFDSNFPGVGRVDRIAFHPTDAATIYIGTPAGGVWKTTDGGANWNALDNYLPILGVSGLAVGTANPDLVYVLSGNTNGVGNYGQSSQGVFKSLDGGNTWTQYDLPTSSNYQAFQLIVHPSNDNIVIVATSVAIYRSQDGGETWVNIKPGLSYDIKFRPGDFRLYTCDLTSVSYSANAIFNAAPSVTWNSCSFNVAPLADGRKSLAVTPADPAVLYVFAGPGVSTTNVSGFYKSTDNGINLNLMTTTPNLMGDGNQLGQWFSSITVAASPTDANTVVTGGLVANRSTNSGVGGSWTPITEYTSGGNLNDFVHPDFKQLAFNPINGWLYAVNDGGIYRSLNNGDNWTDLSAGLGITQFFSLSTSPGNLNNIVAGSQDNGIKFRSSASTVWDNLGGGDGFISAFDQHDSNRFYSSANNDLFRYENSASYLSEAVITPNVSNGAHMQIASDPNVPNKIYVGTRSDTLCTSLDNGDTWTYTSLRSDLCIEVCPSNSNRKYVAGGWFSNPIISRTTDNGVSWLRIDSTGGLPDFLQTSFIPTDLSVRPNNELQMVVTISGMVEGEKIYRTDDGGNSFLNISGNLPNVPTHCAEYLSNGGILVGTDLGVFYKSGYTANWVPFSNNLPSCHISEMDIDEVTGKVTVATYGRGVWQADLPDADCDPSIVWTVPENLGGQKYYEASNLIETRHIINSGGMGTQIFYQSGDHIDFKEGFHARPSGAGVVQGKIAPCGTEIPKSMDSSAGKKN